MHQLNQWHNSYSVYVKDLDDQHKKLIGLLNELYDAYLQNTHLQRVGEIIVQLHDFAVFHFATEEEYFQQCHYERAAEHISAHKVLLERLQNFEAEYQKNHTVATLHLIDFMNDWLHNHICNVDRQYIGCLKECGFK